MTSAGYSGTPLPRKLGIKPGHRVLLLAAPEGFGLGELPGGVKVVRRLGGTADVIVSFHTERAELARRMPRMAFFFVLFVLASIGLPGLNGFWNEFLTILGAFTSEHLGVRFGVLAATGIVLGAIYMLHMTARVIWGPLKTPDVHEAHG